MRSPPAGLRPVVSVSKTISRTQPLSSRSKVETSDYVTDLRLRCGQFAARIDDEIGSGAIEFVRHLPREDCFKLFRCHARPREHPLSLNIRRRGDDDYLVECVLPLCL